MGSKVTPAAVKVGDYVQFSILDDASITYSGKVVGVASYAVAKSMGTDLAARHEDIRAAATSKGITEDLDSIVDQQFIIVDIGDVRPLVVAYGWIQDGVVEIIELGSTYTIKLLNCSKDKAQEALNLLRANGISCKLNVLY